MAKLALQTSNTFSYTFGASGVTSNNYIIAGNNNPILNIFGDVWTIECWVKPVGNYTNSNFLFTKRPTTTLPTAYTGYISTAGAVSWLTNSGGDIVSTGVRVTPNTWNHIAYVNNGANLRIFLNGSNVAINATGGYVLTSNGNVDSVFAIAAHPAAPATTQFFGDISNFRIIKGQAIYSGDFGISTFPVQLPNNAIGYHAGTTNVAASLTGNVILLTCNDQRLQSNGNATINALTYVGDVTPHIIDEKELQTFSYFFPANNSGNATVIATNVTNSLNLNADFTIEMWYYPTSNSGIILERGLGGVTNNTASYVLAWDTVNNNVNFAVANANNTTYSLGSITGAAGSLGSPTINAWNHIAITRATNTWRGFLNGSLNLNVATNSNTPYFAAGRGLTIGGAWANGSAYSANVPSNTINGYISNLRVIRGNSIYNAAFTPSTTQLPNVTNTILLTALTPALQDLSGNHTLAVNGMNQITWSTLTPFKANSVTNANAANVSFTTTAQSNQRNNKIYNKVDYNNYGQMVNIYPAMSRRNVKIYNKIDYNNYGMPIKDVMIYTVGKRQGRIYNKEFANYAIMPVPTNRVTTGNTQYEFWS